MILTSSSNITKKINILLYAGNEYAPLHKYMQKAMLICL